MKNRVAAPLGHGRKLTRRSKHRKRSSSFKRKVKSYLKADYFLYAPLVSRRPSDLSPPSRTLDSFAAAGFRRNETSRTQQKKKKLLQRILEYLQFDSHMYAALIDSPKNEAPDSGPVHRIEKLSYAITRRITTTTATHKAGDNTTPDHHVKENTNGLSEGEAIGQSRRNRISSDSGAMNRELRRLVT